MSPERTRARSPRGELDRDVARRVARGRVESGSRRRIRGRRRRCRPGPASTTGSTLSSMQPSEYFLPPPVDLDPVVVLGAREQVARVGEGRHPAPADQPRVPADVIGVEVGAHHEVDVFRSEADGGEVVEIAGRGPVRPGRVEAALLVVADAGIDQDGAVAGPQHVGLHRHRHLVGGGVEEAGLQPCAVRGEALLAGVGEEEENVEIGLLGFDYPGATRSRPPCPRATCLSSGAVAPSTRARL